MKTSKPVSSLDQPLSMSVHSMPAPELTPLAPAGRAKFLALVLACSLPVLLAMFVFFVFKPSGQVSIGQLIHPAQPMPDVAWTNEKGISIPLTQLKGQWLLINVGDSACQAECAQNLFIQRQLREMLNKDKDRVDRVWLVLGEGNINPEVLPLLTDTTILRVTESEIRSWLKNDLSLNEVRQQLFVVDPQGNAMLRIPANLNGKQANQAKNVLQKLLSSSVVWDKPGR